MALGFQVATSSAAVITLVTGDTGTQSSFTDGTNFAAGGAGTPPSAANDYFASALIRTPSVTGNYTFGGHSLTLSGGAALAYKGNGTGDIITVNNLIMTNGTSANGSVTSYSTSFTLAGNVTLQGSGGIFYNNGNVGWIDAATIGGTGALMFTTSQATQTTNAISLTGANTYSGGTVISAFAYADIRADGALGSGNITVNGGQLKFELGATNNYIADSAKLILSTGLTAGAINLAYAGSDIVGGISLNGGSTYLANGIYAATDLNSLYGSNVFTGTGTLNVGAVPEVSTWILLAIGGILLFVLRKRTRLEGAFRA